MGIIKIVDHPSEDVLISLKRLANNSCVYPGCSNSADVVVSILKRKGDRPCFENSVILCNEHAISSQNGEIKEDVLLKVRNLLRANRAYDTNTEKCNISTREEYLKKVVEEISLSNSLRCVYVGPLPFHPEWYFDIKEGLTKMPSMDRAVSRTLENPDINTKIIVRNDLRYIEKIKSDVPRKLIPILIDETMEKYDKLMNKKFNNTIIFWDLGIYHIPIILDDSCVFAFRSQPRSPVEGGLYTREKDKVEWEKNTFDQLVDMHINQVGSATELHHFLEELLL